MHFTVEIAEAARDPLVPLSTAVRHGTPCSSTPATAPSPGRPSSVAADADLARARLQRGDGPEPARPVRSTPSGSPASRRRSCRTNGRPEGAVPTADARGDGDLEPGHVPESPTPGPTSTSSSRQVVLDGDDFVVNGQKTWDSNGDKATGAELTCAPTRRRPSTRASPACCSTCRTPGVSKPAHQDDGGRRRVQRAVPHRRPCAPVDGSARSTTDGACTLAASGRRRQPLPLVLLLKLDRLLDAAALSADGTSAIRPAGRPGYGDGPLSIDVRNVSSSPAVAGRGAQRPATGVQREAPPSWPGPGPTRRWPAPLDVLGMRLELHLATNLLSSCSLSIAGGTTQVYTAILGGNASSVSPENPKPDTPPTNVVIFTSALRTFSFTDVDW